MPQAAYCLGVQQIQTALLLLLLIVDCGSCVPHIWADEVGSSGVITTECSWHVQIPTVGFLYIAGYIGYVGRSYIRLVKGEQKPTQKEIIIDVPTALKLSAQGATWPLKVIQELRNGTLVEQDDKITVSPR